MTSPAFSATKEKRKIAILGGGMGAIAAAYAITQLPDWASRLEVTIYQRGWRLGGKAASGRNLVMHGRVEEHGLHLWSGSFTQSLAMMRSCYESLNALGLRTPEAALGTFDKAFKPLDHLFIPEVVASPDGTVRREPWRIDAAPDRFTAGPAGYLEEILDLLALMLEEAGAGPLATPFAENRTALAPVRAWLSGQDPAARAETMQRRWLTAIDLTTAAAAGILADDVLTKGFDHLDRWEARAWLARHGASSDALQSSIMAAAEGFAFGYPGCARDHRGIGAGTLLHNLCRTAFGAEDALFYKMQASTGDAVFAPLYQVLRACGVRFRFFHAISELRLGPDGSAIDAIALVRQADPGLEYEPLVTVRNLPSWPCEPLWDHLADGQQLRSAAADFEDESRPPAGEPLTLRRGEDFDDVVLGIGIGALPEMTRELAAASPAWAAMLDHVATAPVRTVQLWLTVPSAEYGWKKLIDAHNPEAQTGNAPLRTVTASLSGDLTAWVDVSDLLVRAEWGFDDRPWSAAAFTGLLPETHETILHESVAEWLDGHLVQIWPDMQAGDGGFLYAALHDTNRGTGRERLGWQFVWSGAHGSQRQVLAVPGSLEKRLAPGASGFANLFLAGDGTRNGLNGPSAEAAVISALQAVEAMDRQG